MDQLGMTLLCSDCGERVENSPTIASFKGQETYTFHPIVCVGCLIKTCEKHSTVCANCGEIVLPYSQIGVLKEDNGRKSIVHMTTTCLTVGSAFHGFWGKGKLLDFMEIEAC